MISGSILLFFFKNQQAKQVHLQRFNNTVIYTTFFALTLIFIGAFISQQDLSIYMLISLMLFSGWLLYELWYCQYPASKTTRLNLGTIFQPQGLKHGNGKAFIYRPEPARRKVFIFFNGNWNQFCRSQLHELSQFHNEINEQGLEIYLISSQNDQACTQLKEKLAINAHCLRDKNNELAQSVGLLPHKSYPAAMKWFGYTGKETCLPAVVVTDIDDIIIYSYVSGSIRVRPSFANLLEKTAHINRNKYIIH